MLAIVILILMCIIYIFTFPGGPGSFIICTIVWLKNKSLARKSKTLIQSDTIKQDACRQIASQSFHPRQRRAQLQYPSLHERPQAKQAESGVPLPSEQKHQGR